MPSGDEHHTSKQAQLDNQVVDDREGSQDSELRTPVHHNMVYAGKHVVQG